MSINSRKRGRPGIKPAISRFIVQKTLEYPDMDRLQLAALLIGEIKAMGEKAPAEDTLVKKISEARNQKISPLDNPWHLGTLESESDSLPNESYSPPSEAIPHIMDVQKHGKKHNVSISIRQAKWVSRLYKIKQIRSTEILFKVSWSYSFYERVCELAGLSRPYDTSKFDSSLLDGTWPVVMREWFFTEGMNTYAKINKIIPSFTNKERNSTPIDFIDGQAFAIGLDGERIPLGPTAQAIDDLKKKGLLPKSTKVPPDNIPTMLLTTRVAFFKWKEDGEK